MASKGHKEMSQTVLATRHSLVSFLKENIQPKIKEWEKEIKKYRKQKDLKREKQLNILFDLLSRMTDQVNQFQSSLDYKLHEVSGDLLKEKSKTVSEDMEKKIAKWHNLSMRTETQDKLEQLLSLILTQVQWWTEKLTKMTSVRQQTPQLTVQHQRNARQQSTRISSGGSIGSPQSIQDGGNTIQQETNTKLQKEVSDLQIKYDSKVAEINQRKKDTEKLMEEIDQLKKDIDEQRKQVKAKEREKDELLNRLSAVAGHKLRDNNPAIADLSSEIRPTKIAEKFKELYDNQWTDAFEELVDQGLSEVSAIQILMTTVEDSFQFTADMARMHLEALEACTQSLVFNSDKKTGYSMQVSKSQTFSGRAQKDRKPDLDQGQKHDKPVSLSEECADLVKQLRKASAQIHVEEIQIRFIKTMEAKKPPEKKEKIIDFYKECARVTWYMNVQTPPLAFAAKPAIGMNLNTDMYAQYTKSGTKVDYVVWPACLLHECGPLLAKGVIQPFKENRPESGKGKVIPNETDATKSQSGNVLKTVINTGNVNSRSGDKEVSTHM